MVTKLSKFGKKRNSKAENIIASVVFVAVLLGVIGFFVYQNISIAQKRGNLEGQLADLQTRVTELSVQQEGLQSDIQDIETEEYQEKLLREQGLYKRQGEEVITVLPADEILEGVGVKEEKQRVWWKPWTW